MKVLLTGAAGQVGRAIALHLAELGHEVTGVSRRAKPSACASYVEADLAAADFVDRVRAQQSRCAAVVHAAACLSHSLLDGEVSQVNCRGTQQVLALAREMEVRRLVFISGVPVIGRPVELPVTEDHPTHPPSAYHASKLFGEHLFRLAENDGCSSVSLRVTSPAGPGTPANRILGAFVRRALANQPLQLVGRGSRRQNYVDVRDVARAVAASLECSASGVYNIAGAEAVSNLDAAQLCIRQLKSSSRVEFLDRPDPEEGIVWEVSLAKAKRDLLYTPRYDLAQSIQAIADECHRSE